MCTSIGSQQHSVSKIVVDPIRHETAAAADIHLQLFPGTDGALAFAILHAIRRRPSGSDVPGGPRVGWEGIEARLDSCTLSWGEATTGVPPLLSSKSSQALCSAVRSLLWMGQGFQRQTYGGNAMRAVGLLPAATGNIGSYWERAFSI